MVEDAADIQYTSHEIASHSGAGAFVASRQVLRLQRRSYGNGSFARPEQRHHAQRVHDGQQHVADPGRE